MIQELELSEKQTEAMGHLTGRPKVREVLFGGAKNGGKSFLGISWLFPSAILYPGTSYFIARKELGDLLKYTVPSVYEFFEVNGLKINHYCILNKGNSTFKFSNGSTIYLLACKHLPSDPLYERFGSMQMTQGWIEEGGEIHSGAYENLKLSIGRWKNDTYKLPSKLLITCNPKKNWMYTEFYKPYRENRLDPKKVFIQSLVTDNNFRQSGAIEVLDGIKDPIAKARLRFGEWDYIGDPAEMVTHDSIVNIFSNEHVIDKNAACYITADIARFGKDATVIRLWRGWEVLQRWEVRNASVTTVADKIRVIATVNKVPMSRTIVDEDGVGGGVADILKCKGFVANSSPFKEWNNVNNQNFDSLKSQCGYYLADKINSNTVYEPAAEDVRSLLIEELGQLKMKSVDTDGKRGLMAKDKIKNLIGRSPDDLDTYIMRAWFEVGGAVSGPSIVQATPAVRKAHNGRTNYSM